MPEFSITLTDEQAGQLRELAAYWGDSLEEALHRAVREALVECCPLPVHACFFGGPDLIGSRLQRNAFEDSPDWLKQICLKLEKALQDLPVLGCQEQFGSNRERLHRSRR
jgi:hypothetical protein